MKTKKRKQEAGNRYGKLTVVDWSTNPGYVDCICDCGNTCTVPINSIRHGSRTSCGCTRRKILSLQRQYNTNFMVLTSNKAYKNSSTGVKGVCWRPKRNKYAAYITLHGSTKFLGSYSNLKDAAEARKIAEEEQFAPLIEEFQANFNTKTNESI